MGSISFDSYNNPHEEHKADAVIFHISQMKTLRLREMKQLVQGNPAGESGKVEIWTEVWADSRFLALSIILKCHTPTCPKACPIETELRDFKKGGM